jgi:hypothetical protein
MLAIKSMHNPKNIFKSRYINDKMLPSTKVEEMPTKRLRPKSFCTNVTFGGGFVSAVVPRKHKQEPFLPVSE